MDLEARITRMEDIEAIRQLKARYCEICDDDHNPGDILTLFTVDGIWEGKGIGRAVGHDEIQALFKTFQQSMTFTQHMVQNPIIEVDGDTAAGRWYFFGMFTFTEGQKRWQAARYHEQYQKLAGQWKIKHLTIAEPVVSARYEKGWRNGT